jgi:hypothetical protein
MQPTYTTYVFGRECGPYNTFREALRDLMDGIKAEHDAKPELCPSTNVYNQCFIECSLGGHNTSRLNADNARDFGVRYHMLDLDHDMVKGAVEPPPEVLSKLFRMRSDARLSIITLEESVHAA